MFSYFLDNRLVMSVQECFKVASLQMDGPGPDRTNKSAAGKELKKEKEEGRQNSISQDKLTSVK